jgi:DNA repair protein RecO (recombination protein O)
MALLEIEGIVIKEINFGEADKIITIFSREKGKIQGCAKGARRPKSPLVSSTQLFSYNSYILFKGKNLYNINQGELIESFYNIRENLEKLYCSFYIIELISDVIEEGSPNEELLNLLLNTLYILSNTDKNILMVKTVFELRMLRILGFLPNVICCTKCNEEFEEYLFNSNMGGIVCKECVKSYNMYNNKIISNSTLAAMRYILYCEDKKIFSFTTINQTLKELNSITNDFIKTHIGKEYSTLKKFENLYFKVML